MFDVPAEPPKRKLEPVPPEKGEKRLSAFRAEVRHQRLEREQLMREELA
jgi:hypothetical protein